jgi:hypothetical protein
MAKIIARRGSAGSCKTDAKYFQRLLPKINIVSAKMNLQRRETEKDA